MGHIAYLGLGSNLGDRIAQCEKAVAEILKINCHKLVAQSSFYRTRPIGYTLQDLFINAVIKIETDLGPLDLLDAVKGIESSLGRVPTFHQGPRCIDIDILFFDAEEIKTSALQIPHPSLHQRQFVLVPLAEIDGDLVHPVFKKSIRELLEDLKEDQGVEKLIS